jgi:hypothetical protein
MDYTPREPPNLMLLLAGRSGSCGIIGPPRAGVNEKHLCVQPRRRRSLGFGIFNRRRFRLTEFSERPSCRASSSSGKVPSRRRRGQEMGASLQPVMTTSASQKRQVAR